MTGRQLRFNMWGFPAILLSDGKLKTNFVVSQPYVIEILDEKNEMSLGNTLMQFIYQVER